MKKISIALICGIFFAIIITIILMVIPKEYGLGDLFIDQTTVLGDDARVQFHAKAETMWRCDGVKVRRENQNIYLVFSRTLSYFSGPEVTSVYLENAADATIYQQSGSERRVIHRPD